MDIKFLKKKLLDKLKLTSYWRRRKKYNLGEHSYISHNTRIAKGTVIGKFCSIADNVSIGNGNHPYTILSTSPFCYAKNKIEVYGDIIVPESNLIKLPAGKPTVIGNDVWIGYGAIIMAGITIGDGAVIGAGAVVTKNVEPYSIVAGVPAKIIKYRFEENIIKELLELKWWDLDKNFIISLPFDNIEKCIQLIKDHKNK